MKKWMVLAGLAVAQLARGAYDGTGTFVKITNRADLAETYYVVASSNGQFAMTHTNAGNSFSNVVISPVADMLADPSPAIVWRIQTNAAYGGLTIFNEASNRYVAYAGTANAAHSVAEVNGATGVWSFAWREDIGCFAASNGALPYRFLQYNAGSPRFSCYSNGTQQHLTLYKLSAPQAPEFGANPGPLAATPGVATSFAVTAAGEPTPVLALESATASDGYSFAPETGALDYLPPAADGGATQTFVFTASNELGVATQAVEVAVDAAAAPEFGANPGPLSATTGVATAFSVSATGVPAPVLALESTTASGGYSFTPETGALDYLPPLADGDATQTFIFTASNAVGVATQAVAVAVALPPPAPPAFGPNPGPLSATTGVAMAFSVSATGEPAPTLALESTTASGGYSFAPETGRLDYLPPLADGGVTQTFVFTAGNELGVATQAVEVAVVAVEPPATLAYDEGGNYEAGAFTNGANRGFGFRAWAFTNQSPELGDSTAGGGGDVNSTNGVSFRFMGDGTNGWCNGRRDFAAALRTGDVARFVLAYNWNGGGRGVDLFCATGKFANLIHVTDGDVFQVNGQTVSTLWAPQAVVAVEIAQETNGIRVGVVRTANGVEDLNVATNILHEEPLAGLGFYCGGYSCAEAENPNYALFANDLEIVGEPVVPPAVTNAATVANSQFRLEWPAETGLVYRVETTADLAEQPWSNATPAGLVFSNAAGACELPQDGPRRFYRFAADRPAATGEYLVVDLSLGPEAETWPVSYLDAVPPGGWTEEYKTTKLVLRRIPAGSFTMGSPAGELGRDGDELQHAVTLTKDFYIGVFEVTQKQWERVMGNWPSYFNNATYRDSRPVEQVSYYDVRENPANSDDPAVYWPSNDLVNADSFMGKLRAKTGEAFDLPTEAQWERACRAGTTNALNSGMDLTDIYQCPNMDVVGRYWYNGGSGNSANGDDSLGSAKVGSYLPNAWGLYDMHGNVWEWCLDWYESAPAGALDPPGPASGSARVLRGGSWYFIARYCRSANRRYNYPTVRNYVNGFRVFLSPGRQ